MINTGNYALLFSNIHVLPFMENYGHSFFLGGGRGAGGKVDLEEILVNIVEYLSIGCDQS